MKDAIHIYLNSLCAGISILFLIAGCFRIPEEEELLSPPLVQSLEISYDVKEVQLRDFVKVIRLYGRFVPEVWENLFFRQQGGRLIHLHTSLGNTVEKGDVLAELAGADYKIKVEHQELLVKKSVLKHRMLEAQRANTYELQMAAIDIRLAELKLTELRIEEENLRLRAPISGTIVYLGCEEGDNVAPFQVIVRIVDPSRLLLECPGYQKTYFPIGMAVDVQIGARLESYPGRIIASPVDAGLTQSVAAETEEEIILIRVSRLPEDVAINDTGKVALTVEESKNTVVLPKHVLKQYSGRTYVNILKNGLKKERDVELGIETATEAEIVTGLQEGDLVIMR